MKFPRQRYQQGSLRRVERKSGDVWEFRFRNHEEAGAPLRQITLSTLEFPTEAKARVALQERVLRMNGPQAFKAKNNPTLGLVIDRFIEEEHLEEIVAQPVGQVGIEGMAYSTASSYLSYLRKRIYPRWGALPINEIRPIEIIKWLKELPLAPKTRGHLKNLMHLLFEKAMLWELIGMEKNPIEFVKVSGLSKRQRRPLVLTPGQFHELIEKLPDPYRTMALVAMCTGLRVSEVLALRWDHLNLSKGTLLVQHGVVNGRIGRVKTEASQDEIPLDGAFVEALIEWRNKNTSTGLVFESPITGMCFHATTIQKDYLKPVGETMGLVGLGWHTFRHTYRSLLDETGAPVGVQQRLMRHSNVATTMNVYGNAALRAKQEANSKVVQMVMKKAV